MERPPMERALSTDVVVDMVMENFKFGDLLNCRFVSKCWNKAASSVLRKRWTTIKNISEEADLMALGECLEQSSHFPFAALKLDKPWKLNSAAATIFFHNYGARFTTLSLNTHLTMRLQDIAPFIHHLPRLSILELGRPLSKPEDAEILDRNHQILDLSSVRTIRISLCYPQVNEDALGQVLKAASSSKLHIGMPSTPQAHHAESGC